MANENEINIVELNEYISTRLDLTDNRVRNSIEKMLLLETSIFKQLLDKLVSNKIDFNDVMALQPAISNNTVSYLITASESNNTLNSYPAKMEFISERFSNFINTKILPFESFSKKRFLSDNNLFYIPNIVGSSKINPSDKFFASYIDILNLYKRYIYDREVVVNGYKNNINAALLEIEGHFGNSIEIKKSLKTIQSTLLVLESNLVFLSTSYEEANSLLYYQSLFGYILRDMFEINMTQPESIKLIVNELITSSTSLNNLSTDGFITTYNKYRYDLVDFSKMMNFSNVLAARMVVGEFYKKEFNTSNNLAQDLVTYNMYRNLFLAIKDYLVFMSDTTRSIVYGELE